jgi:hypothetical protein
MVNVVLTLGCFVILIGLFLASIFCLMKSDEFSAGQIMGSDILFYLGFLFIIFDIAFVASLFYCAVCYLRQ